MSAVIEIFTQDEGADADGSVVDSPCEQEWGDNQGDHWELRKFPSGMDHSLYQVKLETPDDYLLTYIL